MTTAECPQCDGYGFDGFDEDGRQYTCYFCGETGRVPLAVRAAWDVEATDAREYRRYLPPDVMVGMDYDDPHPVRRTLLPRCVFPRQPKAAPLYCEDIPF